MDSFFKQQILNWPYVYPDRRWESTDGQTTNQILLKRRASNFLTPVLKPQMSARAGNA